MKQVLLVVSILVLVGCNVDDEGELLLNNKTNNGTNNSNNSNNNNSNNANNNNGTIKRVAAHQNCAGGGVATGGGYISIQCTGPAGASAAASQGGDHVWHPGASKVIFE